MDPREKQYVIGFAYTEDGRCLLIEKNRPAWQKGSLNGIGGKIEPGEDCHAAMRREAMEEAGLDIEWDYRGFMHGVNNDGAPFVCYIFYAQNSKVADFKQLEDEPLGLYAVEEIFKRKIVDNLAYLVPFGLSGDRALLELTY